MNQNSTAVYNIIKYANFVLKDGSKSIDKSIKSLNLPKFTPLKLDLSNVIKANHVLKNYPIKSGELESFITEVIDL